jgi:hypothetical protein
LKKGVSNLFASSARGGLMGRTINRLALTAVRLAEELDRFLASEMGWSNDVGPIGAGGPDGLCGF